jgi:hypothetical protein
LPATWSIWGVSSWMRWKGLWSRWLEWILNWNMLSPFGPAEQDEGGSRPRSWSSWTERVPDGQGEWWDTEAGGELRLTDLVDSFEGHGEKKKTMLRESREWCRWGEWSAERWLQHGMTDWLMTGCGESTLMGVKWERGRGSYFNKNCWWIIISWWTFIVSFDFHNWLLFSAVPLLTK